MKELKLFVWEGVLSDYTDGIMFALAHDVEEARRVISERLDHEGYPTDELTDEPKVFNTPVGFYLYGGG